MPFRFPRRWTERCADLLESLNGNDVKYLLIGSLARVLHDPSQRQPNDTDLMIARSDQTLSAHSELFCESFPRRTASRIGGNSGNSGIAG